MMQKMREKTQGIIAGVIVFLICLTFALWGIQNYTKSSGDTSVVAVAGSKKITQNMLKNQYEKLKRWHYSHGSGQFTLDQAKQNELKKTALNQLTRSAVLMEAAAKMGFYVSPKQLNMFVSQIPDFQLGGKFSPEKFQLFIERMSYSEKAFFDEMSNSILTNQLEQGIAGSEFVLPSEVDEAIRFFSQTRDFGYFLLEPKSLVSQLTVNDDEIVKYYQQHQDEFLSPELVSIEYVKLSSDQVAKKIQPTANQLKQFYLGNPSYFTVPQKENTPIKSAPPLAQVAAMVKSKYIKQKLVQLFADATDKLTDLTYTNSDSLQPAATALGLTIETTGQFANHLEKVGILSNPKIVKAAFSEAVLKQGYNSNLIEIDPGTVMVLRIKDHLPEVVLPLAKVKAIIYQKLAELKAKEKLRLLSQEVLRQMQNNRSVPELSNKYHLRWETVSRVGRFDHAINPLLLETAFSLSEANNGEVKAKAVDLMGKGYAIVKLNRIYPGDVQGTKPADRQRIEEMLKMLMGRFDYVIWLEEMMKKTKITIEDESLAIDQHAAEPDDE